MIFHKDGGLLHANTAAQEMLGYTPEEIVDFDGLRSCGFFGEKEFKTAIEMFHSALNKGNCPPVELSCIRKDGAPVYLEIHIEQILDNDKRPIAASFMLYDISQKKSLEHENQEMQLEYLHTSRMATLGELARGIAHNINNPLAGLYGYLELLAEDFPDDDRVRKCMKQCDRISNIAKNLAFHGRNTESIERVRTNLNELVDETIKLIGASKLYDNLTFKTDFPENPVSVTINPGDITQVLLNIMRNARDAIYGKKGGVITISAVEEGQEVKLSIADNGSGIPAEIRDKIFSQFFTTKKRGVASTSEPIGNGLGLSTCRLLVEQNEGRLEFTTEVGVGTTFSIYLPKIRTQTPGIL